MNPNWFHSLAARTPTRLWINNPTLAEARQAIAAGAVACTTNPTYCANLLRREEEFAGPLVRRIAREAQGEAQAAHRIQQEMVRRIMPLFLPLHHQDPWRGVVSVQGDPHRDEDPDHILRECLSDAAALPPNYIAKVPVTAAGLRAIDQLLRRNIPVIATEVFSLAQTVRACEVYQEAARASGHAPAYYVTHITGIFDEYLGQLVQRQGIDIGPAVLAEAGFAACCAQLRLFTQRRYGGIMLGGGARAMRHFTDFVGSPMHITINWSTAEEILAADPPLADRIETGVPPEIVAELTAKLPDFARAVHPDGLSKEQFAHYGPVLHFRDKFQAGWDQLLEAIRASR